MTAALLDPPCPVVLRPAVRPTGTPPRCRQCGGICRQNQPGPAIDRCCKGCSSVATAALLNGGEGRQEIPVLAWLAGAPFEIRP